MRKFFIFLLLLIISFYLHSENKIIKFEGGYYNVKIHFFSSSLTGISSSLGNFGNTISSLTTEPAIVSLNPAALSGFRNNRISADFLPKFSINTNSFYDINSKVKNIIDQRNEIVCEPIYPDISIEVGQKGGIKNFAATFSLSDYGTFGFSFHNPLDFSFIMTGNGSSGILADYSLEDTTKVSMSVETFASLDARFNQVDIGFGKQYNNLSFGIGASWLYSKIFGNFDTKFEGVIRRYGTEQIDEAFNDPTVDFRNTLDDSIRLDFQTVLFAPVLAVTYRKSAQLTFDGVFKLPSKNNYDGFMKITQYTLGVLNENSLFNPDEELLDQTLLELSRMTYTNRTVYESTQLTLSYPGKLAASATWHTNNYDFVFSYEKPLGKLLLHYECDVSEDGREKVEDSFQDYQRYSHKRYSYGFVLNHVFKYGFRLNPPSGKIAFSLGGQFIFADQYLKNVKNVKGELVEPKTNILIPSFSTGLKIPLNQNVVFDISLMSLPSPFARIGVTYGF